MAKRYNVYDKTSLKHILWQIVSDMGGEISIPEGEALLRNWPRGRRLSVSVHDDGEVSLMTAEDETLEGAVNA